MDFAAAAETIAEVAERVVERVGVEPGMQVLDVACGTGGRDGRGRLGSGRTG